jgi:Spy/CpxP family protein refolding chaperone
MTCVNAPRCDSGDVVVSNGGASRWPRCTTSAEGLEMNTHTGSGAFFIVLLASAIAVAQPGPDGPQYRGPGPGAGMMDSGMGGMAASDVTEYLAGLKRQLSITPEQESAWNHYAEALQHVCAQMRGMREAMSQAMGTATWEERRNKINNTFRTQQQVLADMQHAAAQLLNALTPQQQADANNMLPGLGWG